MATRGLARAAGPARPAEDRGAVLARRRTLLLAAVFVAAAAVLLARLAIVTRPGAALLMFAHTRRGEQVNLDAGRLTVEDKRLLGCYSADVDLAAEAARLIFSRRLRVAPLISHRFPLTRVAEAFRLARQPTMRSLKILVQP
jgi:L-iditol 2-dehydrogenase